MDSGTSRLGSRYWRNQHHLFSECAQATLWIEVTLTHLVLLLRLVWFWNFIFLVWVHCIFTVPAAMWISECKAHVLSTASWVMVTAHDTCLNFQGVADLSLLNEYVRLANLRGVWKNCTVVMVDLKNVINFRLLRMFLDIACCPWFNQIFNQNSSMLFAEVLSLCLRQRQMWRVVSRARLKLSCKHQKAYEF
jgi:hypothetical protein